MSDDDRTERTRAEDLRPLRWWERAWRWWRRVKDPIIAVAGITGFLGCIVLAIFVYDFSRDRAEDARVVRVIVQEQAKASKANALRAKQTAAAAKLTCERTRRYAPYVIADYEKRHVFPPHLVANYKATLPKSCPK